MIASTCRQCKRKLYTAETWSDAVAPYQRGPFNALFTADLARFHTEWGWQSEWELDYCRFCDDFHDHRESPPLLYRLKRWWRTR